jgi:L-seryl-tRNA(Ser) seleniumtransferase
MLTASDLQERAQWLAARIPGAEVIESTARVGGGALPLVELPGPVVALPDASLAEPLRRADPPLVGRVEHDRLLLDPRTLAPDELETVVRLLADHLPGGAAGPEHR